MTSNPNLQRIVRENIYAMKKEYGVPVSVYKQTTATTNYETGEKVNEVSSVDVRLCPVLPMTSLRKLVQSISYLSGSKPFASQGAQGWDQGTRGFIFEVRDMPLGYVWAIEDWVVYRHKRFDIKQMEEIGDGLAWLIIATEVEGVNAEEIIRMNVVDTLVIEGEPGVDPDNLWRRGVEQELEFEQDVEDEIV